jgi:hypothetical protein
VFILFVLSHLFDTFFSDNLGTMVMRTIVAAKEIVAIALTVLAVSPRLPDDRPFTLGGKLTNRFRLLVVILLILHLARSTVGEFANQLRGFQILLGVLETVGSSFGVLYTPYILQVWLSSRINVGRPGDNLKSWWYAITAISVLGGILADTLSYHFWALKKVANAISVYPVWKTLQTYNSVTMLGGPYPGRGSVLSQLVTYCELYVLLANLADICQALVFIMGWKDDKNEREDSEVAFLVAVCHSSGFAAWIRLLCHSILLNVLDEQRFVQDHTNSTYSPSDAHDDDENTVISSTIDTLALPLINRANLRAV